jgi:hypothetical protein
VGVMRLQVSSTANDQHLKIDTPATTQIVSAKRPREAFDVRLSE